MKRAFEQSLPATKKAGDFNAKVIMETMQKDLSQYIKAEALRLGFGTCGIAHADKVDAASQKTLQEWLMQGKQAGMAYMASHIDKRLDPRLLMEGAQSVICVALNYYPPIALKKEQYQFAWYAYGKDYHDIMKEKLHALLSGICQQSPGINGKAFCDTAPLWERYWAWKAGLGWIGKNTQLIIPQAGSTFFLGEILLDTTLCYDTPLPNRCGNCSKCLEICPTHALEAPYRLNAGRCLSYLTIEHRGEIPEDAAEQMGNCVYGCDRCQQGCPWNRFVRPTAEPKLQASEAFLRMMPEEWNTLSIERYRELFKGSAVKRAKYEGLMRNIRALRKKPNPASLETEGLPKTDWD